MSLILSNKYWYYNKKSNYQKNKIRRSMKNKDRSFKRYVGIKGEDAAAGLLKDKGFNILRRNYAVHNVGEIDIVAEKDGDIHVFEVRTRRNKGPYPDSSDDVHAAEGLRGETESLCLPGRDRHRQFLERGGR